MAEAGQEEGTAAPNTGTATVPTSMASQYVQAGVYPPNYVTVGGPYASPPAYMPGPYVPGQMWPQVTIAGQEPAVQTVYMASNAPTVFENYNVVAARWLGIAQVVIAAALIVLQIAALSVDASLAPVVTGFWCAIIFIIAGAFGIQSSRSRSKCTVITTMVMSIISAVFTVGVVTQTAIGVAQDSYSCKLYYSYYTYRHCDADRKSMIAVNSMMLILAIVETLVAIVASVYCCSACCCGVQAQHMVLPAHVQYVSSGQRIIILTSTQQGMMPGSSTPVTGGMVPVSSPSVTGGMVPVSGTSVTGAMVPVSGPSATGGMAVAGGMQPSIPLPAYSPAATAPAYQQGAPPVYTEK